MKIKYSGKNGESSPAPAHLRPRRGQRWFQPVTAVRYRALTSTRRILAARGRSPWVKRGSTTHHSRRGDSTTSQLHPSSTGPCQVRGIMMGEGGQRGLLSTPRRPKN